jgi:hypothetical protein
MRKPRASVVVTSKGLAKQARAGAAPGVSKVIRFANEDVPRFLHNLRRFEEESRRVKILVK